MGRHKKIEEVEEDFEDVEDEMEEDEADAEVEEAPRPVVKKQQVQGRPPKTVPEEPAERYQPFYRPEVIAVVDTVTKEIVVEGLPSPAIANLEAFKLNLLDKIATVSGV